MRFAQAQPASHAMATFEGDMLQATALLAYRQCIYMRTVLQKWGNSLALRIPRTVAAEIAVGAGHAVDVQVNKGRIVVAPVTKKRYELSDLVGGISAKNRHAAVDSGKPRGRESW